MTALLTKPLPVTLMVPLTPLRVPTTSSFAWAASETPASMATSSNFFIGTPVGIDLLAILTQLINSLCKKIPAGLHRTLPAASQCAAPLQQCGQTMAGNA
ncbi:hypothetical protein [Piscinibacter sakaiensis]|uniref:hypothetical protein n=1 Tax=Piscinibacter sakaiensis TaxID=1547922 RepID=UPI003AACCD84